MNGGELPCSCTGICVERARENKPRRRKKSLFFSNDEKPPHIFNILSTIFITMAPAPAPAPAPAIKYGGRTIVSIRRRYQTLYRKQAPTGSPNMPDDVRQAKRVKHKIGTKAMLGDGEEHFDLIEGFKGEEEELNFGPTTNPTQPTQEIADSTITPSKRTYTRAPTPTGDSFLQAYQLSLQQDKVQHERQEKRWERDRQERLKARDRADKREEKQRDKRLEARDRADKREEKRRDDMIKLIGVAVTNLSSAWSANSSVPASAASAVEQPDGPTVTLDDEEDIRPRKRAATRRKRGLGIVPSSSQK